MRVPPIFSGFVALTAVAGCDLGTTYEGAGPMYYETYTRDPALRVQAELNSMGTTPANQIPTAGIADFDGGFVGSIGGCGFHADCSSANKVYGHSWVRADFASGEVDASIYRLVIEYSETDEYGYHTIGSVYSSVKTTVPGTISGNAFEGVVMSTGNYYGNDDYIISGELDGSFRGADASGVVGNFSGSIAKVTGGYPLGGYETLTGQVSAKAAD